MSVDSFFFVRDEKLPTIPQWQAALDGAGVGIVLEDVGDLRNHSGNLPATFRGQPSGFEWFYGPLAENFGGDVPDGLNGRKHVINCVTHSDMTELVCGLIACSVLSQVADGVFLDEESGGVVSANQALQMALGIESQEQERKKRAAEKDAALPHHLTCGSASGGSSKRSKVAPELFERKQSLFVQPFVGHRESHGRRP